MGEACKRQEPRQYQYEGGALQTNAAKGTMGGGIYASNAASKVVITPGYSSEIYNSGTVKISNVTIHVN